MNKRKWLSILSVLALLLSLLPVYVPQAQAEAPTVPEWALDWDNASLDTDRFEWLANNGQVGADSLSVAARESGYDVEIHTSKDGKKWIKSSLIKAGEYEKIYVSKIYYASKLGKFILLGQRWNDDDYSGKILIATSTDGKSWTEVDASADAQKIKPQDPVNGDPVTIDSDAWLKDITEVPNTNGTLVAVGTYSSGNVGFVLYSKDSGVTWTYTKAIKNSSDEYTYITQFDSEVVVFYQKDVGYGLYIGAEAEYYKVDVSDAGELVFKGSDDLLIPPHMSTDEMDLEDYRVTQTGVMYENGQFIVSGRYYGIPEDGDELSDRPLLMVLDSANWDWTYKMGLDSKIFPDGVVENPNDKVVVRKMISVDGGYAALVEYYSYKDRDETWSVYSSGDLDTWNLLSALSFDRSIYDMVGHYTPAANLVLAGRSIWDEDDYGHSGLYNFDEGTVTKSYESASYNDAIFVKDVGYVAVGDNGLITYGKDGGTDDDWQHVVSGVDVAVNFTRVVYDGTKIIAVGEDTANSNAQKAVSSTNGYEWAAYTGTIPAATTLTGITNVADYAEKDGKYVAVKTDGKLYTSADNETWTEVIDTNIEGAKFKTVATGLGYFVAAGEYGDLYVSADNGTTWSKATTPITTKTITALAFGKYGFVALADGEQFAYTQQKFTLTYDPNGDDVTGDGYEAYSYSSGQSVYVESGGDLERAGYGFAGWNTKADGTGKFYGAEDSLKIGTENVTLYAQWAKILPDNVKQWKDATNDVTSPESVKYNDITSTTTGDGATIAIAVGDDGVILRSTDNGVTWKHQQSGLEAGDHLLSVATDGTKFIALSNKLETNGDVQNQVILTSTDGITWTKSTISFTKNNVPQNVTALHKIKYTQGFVSQTSEGPFPVPGNFTVLAKLASEEPSLTSTDGSEWSNESLLGGMPRQESILGGLGNLLYAFLSLKEGDLSGVMGMLMSDAGEGMTIIPGVAVNSMLVANDTFIFVGDNGDILRADGENFPTYLACFAEIEELNGDAGFEILEILLEKCPLFFNVAKETTTNLQSVAFGQDMWVAVGDNGDILLSNDKGINWEVVDKGERSWNSVAFVNGSFVAVGDNGQIRYLTISSSKKAAAPTITTQPADKTVTVGGTASLSVVATADTGTLSYQWYSNTQNSTGDSTLIDGATSATYKAPTSKAGTTYYYVVVTNTLGESKAEVTSNIAKVTVNVLAPTITTQPADKTVTVGGTAELSVVATADTGTLSYQWYKNTTNSTADSTLITSATTATYTAPTTQAGTTYYYVVVTNTVGESTATTTSDIAKVTVNAAPPSGGGGDSTPSQPTTEQITADVKGTTGSDVAKTQIERVTETNGTVKDKVAVPESIAKEIVEKAKEQKIETARIVIPDATDKVAETRIDVPKAAVTELNGGKLNLEIKTENVTITIPATSLETFKDDLYFRVVPIKTEPERQVVENRAKNESIIQQVTKNDTVKVLGRPMEIETNMQSRAVTLVLPLKGALPTDPAERAKIVDDLGVFIEHSDGTKELAKGTIVTKDGVEGLEFTVNKFSTFTMVYMDGFKDFDTKQAVAADNTALAIGYATGDNATSVTQDVTLSTTGVQGSTITWTSDKPEFIANDGKVTRPTVAQGDQTVTLTATIKKGTVTETKVFTVVVKAPTEATPILKDVVIEKNGQLIGISRSLYNNALGVQKVNVADVKYIMLEGKYYSKTTYNAYLALGNPVVEAFKLLIASPGHAQPIFPLEGTVQNGEIVIVNKP